MKPRYIILHTAAYEGGADIDEIRRWHMSPDPNDPSKPWDDVGYHYYIRRNGEIQKGRDEKERGAHCTDLDMNGKSIGICFEGHGDIAPLTTKQVNSLVKLYLDINERWGIDSDHVLGHRETGAQKTCPGEKVDMDQLRDELSYHLRLQFLPERQGDEIDYQTVSSAELPVWDMKTPVEYTTPVSDGNTLAEFRSSLREQFKKLKKRKRIASIIYNGGISLLQRITKIPELSHLKISINTMELKDKISAKLQSTKESYAWAFTLFVVIGGFLGFGWTEAQLISVYEIVTGAVVAVLAAYYAIKDLLIRED